MDLYSLRVIGRNGSEFLLDSLRGKVVIVVNTDTGCGFTS